MIAEEICDSKTSLSDLTADVKLYPQYTKNIRVKDKAAVIADENVAASLEKVTGLINGKGRALLRQSGTEPVIRIMIESETENQCQEYADIIANAVINGGHCTEA